MHENPVKRGLVASPDLWAGGPDLPSKYNAGFPSARREENEGAPLLALFEKGALRLPTPRVLPSSQPDRARRHRVASLSPLVFFMWTKPKRYYGAGHLHL